MFNQAAIVTLEEGYISFPYLWQNGGKTYFGSCFLRFKSMVTWFYGFWACGEIEHYVGEGVNKPSWPPCG